MKSISSESIASPDKGDFNTCPPNLRIISPDEFGHGLTIYTPIGIEYRQVTIPKALAKVIGNTWLALQIFWKHDGTAVAIANPYMTDEKGKYDWHTVFFAIGCAHDYHELSYSECSKRGIYHAGKCWHVHECSKCKHIDATDSSD